MSEPDSKLDFSLPARSPSASSAGGGKLSAFLLVVITLLVITNLVVLLQPGSRSGGGSTIDDGLVAPVLPADLQRKLALKLEGQGLTMVAAQAWADYLDAAAPGPEDEAPIWYRIGKLHQEAGNYEQALAAFYRAESVDPKTSLADEIGRRAQESLEALGKFAALKHELTDRVSMDGSSSQTGAEVIAEIGSRKITRTELDQQIEANIENQLARFAAQMPDDQRKRQKEAMLKQFSSDDQRLQFLNSFIIEEILYRKARESKLTENAKVRAQLQQMERGLLAQQMMAAELQGKINISEGDLQTFYEARKASYVEPEAAQISHILLSDESAAKALAEELAAADEQAFALRAKEVSEDDATKSNGGELASPIVKGQSPPAGLPAEIVSTVLQAGAGKPIPEPVKGDNGYHLVFVRGRSPERQKAFDEVRDQVYRELRARKENEVQQGFMDSLLDEYDVVIHQSKFKQAEGEK